MSATLDKLTTTSDKNGDAIVALYIKDDYGGSYYYRMEFEDIKSKQCFIVFYKRIKNDTLLNPGAIIQLFF